jgi:hypothetical protein
MNTPKPLLKNLGAKLRQMMAEDWRGEDERNTLGMAGHWLEKLGKDHPKGCERCGAELVRDCMICGAPNCCPRCCQETTREIFQSQRIAAGTANEKPLCPSSLTPETDAMMETDAHRIEEYSAPLTAYRRMCDLSRTLERERDEWRKKAVELHARSNSLPNMVKSP